MSRTLSAKIPLALTLLRVLLAPLLLWFAWRMPVPSAFAVSLLLALFSDIFDGIIARRLGVATPGLRRLDSVADTLFYVAAVAAVWHLHREFILESAIPLGILLTLEITRYLFDLSKFGREASYHMWSSKLWGLALFLAFFSALVFARAGFLFSFAIYLGIIADIEGLMISFILPSWQNDIPTIVHALRIRRGAGEIPEAPSENIDPD
ncbi:MAG: CDP-alcohol phosphatidyltransferase family protein [Bacteroidota bacterium]